MNEERLGIYVIKEHEAKQIVYPEKGFRIAWEVYGEKPGSYETDEGIIRGMSGLLVTWLTSQAYNKIKVYFCGGSKLEGKVKSQIQKENAEESLRYLGLQSIYEEVRTYPVTCLDGKNTEEGVILLKEELDKNGIINVPRIDVYLITSPYHLPRSFRLMKKYMEDYFKGVVALVNAHNFLQRFLEDFGKTDNVIYEAIKEDKRRINIQRLKYYAYNLLTLPLQLMGR